MMSTGRHDLPVEMYSLFPARISARTTYGGAVAQSPPRSLADDLRGRDDDALADLLTLRPDLTVPPPEDLTSLAAAAAGRLSVQRAIDGLDTPTLQVLEVLAVLPEPVSAAEVGRRWGATATSQLATLRALALVWGTPRALRLVRAARDSLGPHPAGLGPPLADALDRRSPSRLAELLEDLGLPPTGDPVEALRRLTDHLGRADTVNALLTEAPDGARELLDRLTWGPPVGRVNDADRPVRTGTAASPVDWLLAHGLLAVADPGHVVLPREIALALRGGRVHRQAGTTPPALTLRDRPARQVDGTAAGAADEAVRLVTDLGRLWGGELGDVAAPPVLRAGGLGVRDLRRLASALDVDDATAALVVELAHAAGLVADDGETDPAWLPTSEFDEWVTGSVGERWAHLVAAWWDVPRAPGLVGTRDARDSPIAALSGDVERPQAVEVRRRVLGDLLGATTGTSGRRNGDGTRPALAGGPTDADTIVARLEWAAPRRVARLRVDLAAWTLREAAWLGVTGAGAISSAGLALLHGLPGHPPGTRPDAALPPPGDPRTVDRLITWTLDLAAGAAALDAALPPPVDRVVLQADLTAVAPGPLTPDLAGELALAADVESRGGATVYRFSPGSVRRALDAGRTGDDLLRTLADHSSTPVPQPLTYLVTDTARRYGRLRVGAASAYLRAEDPAVLEELLADRRTATLRLRRLAPTVLAAEAAPETVLSTLRAMGLVPAAETPDGDLLIRRPDARRVERRPDHRADRRSFAARPPVPARTDLLAAVQRIRAADENPAAGSNGDAGGPLPDGTDPASALAVLRDAAGRRREVWISYLEDPDRLASLRILPLGVDAGRVRVLDQETGRVRLVPVHRLLGVSAARPDDDLTAQ
jgi:hypothetical protein